MLVQSQWATDDTVIRNVDERSTKSSSLLCVPGDVLLPVTAATFDILITLSEDPRKDGFKAAQIDVSNATCGRSCAFKKVH